LSLGDLSLLCWQDTVTELAPHSTQMMSSPLWLKLIRLSHFSGHTDWFKDDLSLSNQRESRPLVRLFHTEIISPLNLVLWWVWGLDSYNHPLNIFHSYSILCLFLYCIISEVFIGLIYNMQKWSTEIFGDKIHSTK
jgi:hypothetical protein